MEISNEITTPSLRRKIGSAIPRIASLFELSPEETDAAMNITVRRNLDDLPEDEYGGYDLQVPGYCFKRNFFYFPPFDSKVFSDCIDSDPVIYHETTHYLHATNNPQVKKEFLSSIRKDISAEHEALKASLGLIELVADYPNLILGLRKDEDLTAPYFKDLKRVFRQYGPKFLPTLARMNCDDAIREGIVSLS
ncbi:hypothetical protein HOA55_01070 [archaeon]|jgi:hypothetical protein|nr:hypothetical protein [archaeon]MBT3577551.1 hypothetical protein [archaeon]MBT6819926.1 hypothetical protein [archaeon]MBT6956166.1 hypothetical protein [archaeon]MBT7025082.1 hypothetical protein [archaeon]